MLSVRAPSPGKFFPRYWHCSSWRVGVSSSSFRRGRSRSWRSRVTPLAKLLEAALFASGRPIPTEELAALDDDASAAAVAAALDEIREHYDVEGHGAELLEIAGRWPDIRRAELT